MANLAQVTAALLMAVVFGCPLALGAGPVASWYGEEHRGKPMANGKPFDPDKLTCASWFHPLGTRLRVTYQGRSVVVTVTDRGPAWRLVREGRKIDLSRAAFRRLAPLRLGLVRVGISRPASPDPASPKGLRRGDIASAAKSGGKR